MFSALTTCYLFLGGTGAGGLTILSALELANLHRHNDHRFVPEPHNQSQNRLHRTFALPDVFFSYGWPLCFVTLSLGMLCLAVDIGRPDRIINLFLHPALTVLTVGSYALVVSLVCSAIFSLFSLLETPTVSKSALYVLIALSLLSGLITMAYTGVLLQNMASVLHWRSPLLPVIFITSSLSCGIALVFLGASFIETRYPFVRPIVWLSRIDSLIIVVEAICLVFFVIWGFTTSGTRLGAEALIVGDLKWLFLIGIGLFGLAIPFVMERFVTHGNYRMQLLWIGAFVLAGGLILRICIVDLALYDITHMPEILYSLRPH